MRRFCLEKITERLDEKHYRLQLMYNKSDETEMVIRILSFGPLLRVQEPAGFIELLRYRLRSWRCGRRSKGNFYSAFRQVRNFFP